MVWGTSIREYKFWEIGIKEGEKNHLGTRTVPFWL